MALALHPTLAAATATKKVALVIRVSTDRQAANTEGSLRNQVQRLRQHYYLQARGFGRRLAGSPALRAKSRLR